jgi:hypothetical protein
MSIKETYSLAHTAQCKLHMAVNAKDRDWRFIVGHATHLDSLMFRIVQYEEEIEQAPQSAIKFKGASKPSQISKPSPLGGGQRRAKSPPPPARADSDSEEEIEDEDADDDLGLMRFPSGSAKPPQQPEPPALDPSDGDSSSSDEDDELQDMLAGLDLKSITKQKPDEEMKHVYNAVNGCPCHKSHAPPIENFWELPGKDAENGGIRTAVVEVRA